MSEIITKACTQLEHLNENPESDSSKDDILNGLNDELNRLQSSNIVTFRQEINKVTTLLSKNTVSLNETILNFFIKYLIELLKQWQQLTDFNDSNDSNTFENLVEILSVDSTQFRNTLLVQELVQCLNTIGRIGKDLFTNKHITIITRMLKIYTGLESYHGYRFMEVTPLDDPIINCICTPYTIEVFSQFKLSAKSEERTPVESFVFQGLFGHVDFLNRNKLQERALDLRKHLLPSISDLLDEFETKCNDWSESSIETFTNLTTLFLYSVQLTMPSDIHIEVQIRICDTAIRILLLPSWRVMKINNNCLQYVYQGTSNDKTLDYLKSQALTATMFSIANKYKQDSEIQFNVYRILAALMTEEDIKRLADPGAIAKVFLDHLRDLRVRTGWEVRIRNLLMSLKILLQHDQIRDEIYKQDGIALFIECVTDAEYDTLIKQRALENLLIMSFSENARSNIKQDSGFVEYLKSLSEDTTKPDLQRAAECLLWLLTKDEASKESDDTTTSKNTYDIMISYSHKDKDLVFQIYDRLLNDNFRVWIDREQMHGTPLESMSNAIENSEFVFVCMSDAYKQSGYCKMEAYYALERQCSIIPLVVKSQYRPDGWLGIIVTGRMRIDFPKYGFEDGYNKLKIEIDRSRKQKKKDSSMQNHSIPLPTTKVNASVVNEVKVIEKPKRQAKSDYHLPTSVSTWTNEDVQQFLLKHQLHSFLPICAKMNGSHLHQLYSMCQTNSPLMLQSLNNQLAMKNNENDNHIIELIEYLQFLDALKSFVPLSSQKIDTNIPQSTLCVIV